MLKKSIFSNAGLFRALSLQSSALSTKAGPYVIFMHVNGSIKGTYHEDSKLRQEMIKYATHYNIANRFVDTFPRILDKKIEESREYCERYKSVYEAFMQEEAAKIVQAIDGAAYLAAEHADSYNQKESQSPTDFDNTIVQVQWPEHSFVIGGGVGPEGGAIPEEIFQKHIALPLSRKILTWPKYIHMDASSMLVSIVDRHNSLFKRQFENQLFCGSYDSAQPFIFNTSLLLEASRPITLTTKHAISMTNLLVGLRTDDYSRNLKLEHDQVNSDNTQLRQTPSRNQFMVVQALCLDGDTSYNVPFRSALNWSFEKNNYQTLQDLKGYTIISSDTILFDNLDGMTHLLLSQADTNTDRSAVVLLDHSDQRIKNFNSIVLNVLSNDNPYVAKSMRCFETIEMQPARPKLISELQELEAIISENDVQARDNKSPETGAPGV